MTLFRIAPLAIAAATLAGVVSLAGTASTSVPAMAEANAAQTLLQGPQVVGMRRLTEAQYRNTIADIFGSDIRVAGRFEPIVRPAHQLIASGARSAAITPAGLEQMDGMARDIARQVFDEAHRAQFMSCTPADPAAADPECARRILAPIGRLLFRRPLTAQEEALYVKIAGEGAAPTRSFTKGLELALGSMLVSPWFLYVVETAEPDPDHAGGMRLDNASRAARLSFMLWNSSPNAALLDDAAGGRLTDQAQLEKVVTAMVASPRFEQGLRAFFSDMLLFEKFDELAKDPVIYPYFNQDVLQALPEQMLRTITTQLLDGDGDYRELFTTRKTWMNRPLGALYQVPVSKSQGWVPYEFSAGSDRSGLLGLAGFLAMYSHSGRSSPTLRGRAIRELLLCQPVPNPPGNVNFTAVQDVTNKAMPTARIRLDAHTTDPVCAGCHKITDPIGLPLERFDGIGAFRTRENDAAIDVGGSFDEASFSGADGLGKAIAASQDATMCVTSRALEYATGRPSEDGALVETLESRFAADGYRLRKLIERVATMPQAYEIPGDPLKSEATHVATRR
ncbi:DUF1588 domain-containing protein [Novosphingobium sp. ST904]|uniref:DUF1588 domain-containing protein n=2 Tax=Novosphingobium sp. ST904 TaxID=1684385 RepID=UPI0010D9EB06|nr:DUF1588 domain-containing protein [Novosphingobium sp. ST904]TCM36058.1 uncharacterized protein DUF1587 [Novosphingobium sp. ST904]